MTDLADDPLGVAAAMPVVPDPASDPLGAAKDLPVGKLVPSETPGAPGLSLEHHLALRLRQERTWESVAPELKNAGVDPEQFRQQYQLDEARAVQKGEGASDKSTLLSRTLDIFGREYSPFSGIARNVLDKRYTDALAAFKEGKATGEQIGTIARYERIQGVKGEMGKSFAGQAVQSAGKLAAIAGESAAVGPLLGRVPGGYLARQAVATPLMPSLYQEHAAAKNIQEGRSADDIRGFPPAIGLGYAQNLVLGKLPGMGSRVPGGTIGRAIGAGVVGTAANQGVDIAAGIADEYLPKAYKTETNYGTIGKIIGVNGQNGDVAGGAKDALISVLGFGVFAAIHGTKDPLPEAIKAMDHAGPDAVSQNAARIREALARNPDLNRDQARTLFQDEPPGPVLDAALALADTLPAAKTGEKAPESPQVVPPEQPSPPEKPVDPLADLSPEQIKQLAAGVGLSPKGLREQAGQPWVKLAVDQVLGRKAPEAPTAEAQVGEPQKMTHAGGEEMIRYPINRGGAEIGEARVIERNDGKTLHLEWIGGKGRAAGEKGTFLGREMPRILQEIAARHPKAEFLTGLPVGGRNPGQKRVLAIPGRGQSPPAQIPAQAEIAAPGAPGEPVSASRVPPAAKLGGRAGLLAALRARQAAQGPIQAPIPLRPRTAPIGGAPDRFEAIIRKANENAGKLALKPEEVAAVRQALAGKSLREAAAEAGVSYQTIANRLWRFGDRLGLDEAEWKAKLEDLLAQHVAEEVGVGRQADFGDVAPQAAKRAGKMALSAEERIQAEISQLAKEWMEAGKHGPVPDAKARELAARGTQLAEALDRAQHRVAGTHPATQERPVEAPPPEAPIRKPAAPQSPQAKLNARRAAMLDARIKGTNNPWLKVELEAHRDGTVTFAAEIRNRGGIDPKSLSPHERQVAAETFGVKRWQDVPIFKDSKGKRGRLSIDQMAAEIGARFMPDRPDIHGTDQLLQLAEAHVPVEVGADQGDKMVAEHEARELEHFKERAREEIRSEYPGWDEAQVEARVDAIVQGSAAHETENPDSEPAAQAGEPEFRPWEFGGIQLPGFDPPEGHALTGERMGEPKRETALANRITDKEREQHALPPLMAQARLANERVWDEAMTRIDREPGVETRLINELVDKTRATTVQENALLLHRRIELSNEHHRAMSQLLTSKIRGADAATLDVLNAREVAVLKEIDRLDQVIRDTGSEWGRAGQFRRQLAREDYSLSSMLLRAELAKGKPLTVEEKADITKKADDIKKADDALAAAETDPKQAPPAGDKGDVTDLRIETKKARRKFVDTLDAFRWGQLRPHQKVIQGVRETFNAARSLVTTFDLSAVFRQGGFLAFAHPVKAGSAFPEMFRSLASERGFERAQDAIKQRANALLYEQSGLYLADRTATTTQEEAFLGRWVHKIPGVAASERAYVGFLNRIRADVFDSLAASHGRELSPADGHAVANFINVATGRAPLGQTLEKAAVPLSQLFFSPRFMVSRFQLLAGQPLYQGSTRTRGLLAAEYGRALAGLGVFYGLAAAANSDERITFDPRSSDFGKVRFGKTRLDPLAGLAQTAVFVARIVSGEERKQSGALVDIRGSRVPYAGDTVADVIANFIRSKLAPVPGEVINRLNGKNMVGEPTTTPSNVKGLVVPMAVQDVYKVMEDQGFPRSVVISLLAILGMSTQTYESGQKPHAVKPILQRARELIGSR